MRTVRQLLGALPGTPPGSPHNGNRRLFLSGLEATRLTHVDYTTRRVLELVAAANLAAISLRDLRTGAGLLEPPVSDAALLDALDRGLELELLEESFDFPEVTAEAQVELSRAGAEIARMAPALEKLQRNTPCFNKLQEKMHDSQKKLQQRTEKIRHEFSGEWTEI